MREPTRDNLIVQKYLKGNKIVEAIQFGGDGSSTLVPVQEFIGQRAKVKYPTVFTSCIEIEQGDKIIEVLMGDWVIKNKEGISVCKSCDFPKQYRKL